MIRKFFFSKLFVLFGSMLILGFIIGYDYSVITSREHDIPSAGRYQKIEEINSEPDKQVPEEKVEEDEVDFFIENKH